MGVLRLFGVIFMNDEKPSMICSKCGIDLQSGKDFIKIKYADEPRHFRWDAEQKKFIEVEQNIEIPYATVCSNCDTPLNDEQEEYFNENNEDNVV